ncbi:hypothetical protein RD110_09750 [Rhodoferax koreense]|uniref:Uncharacterized protein n=1 Tax=Rhodoferax koreensis TaxID=1842727 RepID=A0A1P8JUM6_9BURK|nr:hypothetical protein [Rhodoferax koreense]APW37438.1 hypothetical protein RD110_09750 [Rhodoferax koreense]
MIFLLIGIAIVGLAAYAEIGRRKRAAAERRAAWKAHEDWLRRSGYKPPPADDGPRMGHR